MVRPTSKSLLDAAKLIEDEAAAEKVRLDAVTAANNAEAAKKTIEAKTDAALLNAGVGVAAGAPKKGATKAAGNGSGGSGNNGGNGNGGSGNGSSFASSHFQWLLAALVLLMLVVIIALAWIKADKSQVEHLDGKVQTVEAKADDALAQTAKNKTRIEVVNGDVEKAALVASMANDKAEKALNKPACSDSCSKREYVYPKKQKSVASKPVHKPQSQKPVSAPPQSITPPPVAPVKPAEACCTPTPTAQVLREEDTSKSSKICGIAIMKNGDVVGRLQLDNNPERPGFIRIAKVGSFGGVPSKVFGTPMSHSMDCNVDQASVYAIWAKVLEKFDFPNDCVPVKR